MDDELKRAISIYLAIEVVKKNPQTQTLEQTLGYAKIILDWINNGSEGE